MLLDLTQLDAVLKSTIDTISRAHQQMFSLAESARDELTHLEEELRNIQKETGEVIDAVDKLEVKEKASRRRLAHVSKNFKTFSEEDIKEAYDNAKNLQIKLALLRDKEIRLREKRTEVEFRYKNVKAMVKKAEGLISQVGVAMDFLSNNFENIWEEVGKVQAREGTIVAVIKAQEEERKRVAREIHDGPAQSLANVVLQVEYCQKLLEVDPSQIDSELSLLKQIAISNLENIRKIIFALRPMDLDDLGLVPAIKRFMSEFEKQNGISIKFKFVGRQRRYPSAIEVAVFRIIQEALNNVAKHAEASHVKVLLETQANTICAIIRDDGLGFDPDTAEEENSFGIRGMKERTDLLGGSININSAPGKGTEIFLRIPVEEEDYYESDY